MRAFKRRPDSLLLIEGQTDAVSSNASSLVLPEERRAWLQRLPVSQVCIAPRSLETVGYGECYLLAHTQRNEWRNRRDILRHLDDFVRKFPAAIEIGWRQVDGRLKTGPSKGCPL